jgi:excisionase family DNA binding protein
MPEPRHEARRSDEHAVVPLLDTAEAAEFLRVTERWVRRAVAERTIPFVKIGRYVRFELADLEAYKRTNRVPVGGRAA